MKYNRSNSTCRNYTLQNSIKYEIELLHQYSIKMQNLNFLETEFLDILFRGKNKSYGAYTLRKYYPRRIRNAVMVMMATILSFALLHLAIGGPSIGGLIIPQSYPDIPDITKIDNILPPQTPQTAVPLSNPMANPDIPTKVVETITPIVPPEDNKIKPKVFTGPAVGEGEEGLPNSAEGGTDPNGEGAIASGRGGASSSSTSSDYVVVDVAQKMPQFPGGEKALMEYLARNINYPQLARSNGVEGVVYVEFVVNTSGRISNIKIRKGIGYGCESETKRVIKSMPTWEPGENNGSKVNVSYTIPVSFEM